MRRLRFSPCFLLALALIFLNCRSDAQQSPIGGRNVNMVSGTSYPGGDPFLQRQNEVTVAVSTRNAQHLFAGANDYRSVDIPGVGDPFLTAATVADAWLGVFKSKDGGSSWSSVLLPGYPQDTTGEGLTSPIKGFTTATDPIVRAGTNGMFYVGGVAFNRDDQQKGVLFVARYIDNNNKETGDSVPYIGTQVVARGASGRFLDKPWLAVDIPRTGGGTCSVQTKQSDNNNKDVVINQSFPAGNVYVAYSEFVGNTININSRIMFARSTDCGTTWSNPVRITEGSPTFQGAAIAIDPNTGYVYVAWRQIKKLNSDGTVAAPDAIWIAKSVNQGASFTSPVEVVRFGQQSPPFDQATSASMEPVRRFRSRAYPAMTVDASGRVYVAWSQYGVGSDGGARIAVKTSSNGQNWSGTATVLADSPPSPKGHQIMPSLTFAAGKLMMTYYDFRDDLAYAPPPVGPQPPIPSSGNIVDDPSTFTSGRPFYQHTMDARAAQADPADAPLFVSTRVSKYLFDAVGTPGSRQIRQLQYNPPNLPLFDQGRKPFIGDYIDIAAQTFVFVNGQWQWNTASSNSTPFHAAWADNRDVQPPPAPYDWTKYTAAGAVAGQTSIFDPTLKQPEQCDSSRAGMRDQNTYTSRITQGLVVTIPGNSKPLGRFQRAYVVFVQNTGRPIPSNPKLSVKYFRLSVQQPLPVGTIASFLQFRQQNSIDVAIPARSSVARSVFVTSNNPQAAVTVNVQEITGIGAPDPLPGGLTSAAVINPDILNPDILNPDILNPDILNIHEAEVYNPDILNKVEITSIRNPDILNPDILNPDILNPDILNPDILNPDILNPDILNPDILNPDILNRSVANPDILNPDILNPDILNPSLADVKDIIWNVTNKGNTTAAFTFKNFANRNPEEFAFQLLIYKIYATPALNVENCQAKPTMHQELVVNILNPDILNPDILNPDILNSDISNATFYLAPFESGKVALRVIDKNKNDDVRITVNGGPIPDPTPGVPQVFPVESVQIGGADLNAAIIAQEVNTEDAARGITTPPSATARLTIITQELPSGRVGQPYSAKLQADGGTPPYTWSLIAGQGATPNAIGNSGLTLMSSGDISGTPTIAGTVSFSVQVMDAAGDATIRDLAIAVSPPLGTASLTVVSQPNPCFDTLNPQPACARVNEAIVPATSVKAVNNTGTPVAGISVTLNIAPAGAILLGTLTRTTNANGVAAFDDLKLNLPGTYRLSATAAGFSPASTGDFNVLAQVAILVVDNANDGGSGSLRQAMLDGSALPGSQLPLITFNIPGVGSHTILLTSPLPTITRPVWIDATTQPGYGGQPVVQVNGVSAGTGANGFSLTGGSSIVRGFAIGGFDGNGILLQTGGNNRIAGNYLGTNLAGNAPFSLASTGGHAIFILDSSNNRVGGTSGTIPGGACKGDCNVIIARAVEKSGVQIVGATSTFNQILGNFIGIDASGGTGLNGVGSFGLLTGGNNTVIGDGTQAGRNVISGTNNGIVIQASNASIKGNYIGTNAAGTAAIINNFDGVNNRNGGISINGGDHALVENNVISGNDGFAGVVLSGATANSLRGNIVGLNAAGDAAISNGNFGILIENGSNNNIVGGATATERNFISGNLSYGVSLSGGPAVTGNRIIGNYIGTNLSGTAAIANGADGVFFDNTPGNFIGGTLPGEGNLISGNAGNGILVSGSANGTQVVGNMIGLNSAGNAAIPNASHGVFIQGAANNNVGALSPSASNVIAFNLASAVAIAGSGATGNSILGNSIFANGGIAIDLGNDGITSNDPLDADSGPNNFQNFPSALVVTINSVQADLFSAPNTNFAVQFFSSDSSNREGKTLVTTVNVTTDAAGHASIGPVPVTLSSGKWISATATDPGGSTSEVSPATQVP